MMLSIIIPAFNQHQMTVDCINAVRAHTPACEIILVDNGSTPPIAAPYTGFIQTTVIRNEENRGFPASVNQGIAAAKGETIIVLNNDVIVTPGWADKLEAALADYDIVGPVTNFAAGMQRVQIGVYENEEELNKAAEVWAQHWGDHIQEVKWVIGFCMAFRRSLAETVGPFDESLWPCCGEEIDFCLRAREAGFPVHDGEGYRVGIVMGCYVHHEGSVTFKDINAEHPYEEIVTRNEAHLAAKWGPDWHQQEIGASPTPQGVCLNLGSGYNPREGFVNIDVRSECKPDLVCNVLDGLPYADNSVDMVRADDFLEHIPLGKTVQVISEIWRVLKPGGVFESLTPSTDGRGAFQDPTHVSFWNQNSWLYYSVTEYRNLYGIQADFEIESIEDRETNPGLGIIHTHVLAKARK